MMFRKYLSKYTILGIVSIGILIALFTGIVNDKATIVPAAHSQGPEIWTSCTPVEVTTYTQAPRIHVRCAQAVNGIRFFAAGTADASSAARVLTIITTAQVAGRTLTILYDPSDLSGASIGCQVNDCRLILAVGFGQ